MILEILISAVSVELTEWEADVIIHIANCSLEDTLIATLLPVFKDFIGLAALIWGDCYL